LLYALKLALGERGDSDKIREGAEKGRVTALFEIEGSISSLEEAGFSLEETLLITREISKIGKSRAFLNHEPVQVSLLKELGRSLITTLDQGSSLLLKEEKEHLHFLDLAAKNGSLLDQWQTAKEKLHQEEKELQQLFKLSQERERERAILEREQEEITAASIQPGEEEEIFQEFRLLSTAEERRSLMEKCQTALQSAVSHLHPRCREIEQLKELDPSLDLSSFSTLLVECNELRRTLDKRLSSLDVDQERLQQISDRLTLIEKLKKRYGENVLETLRTIVERLSILNGLEDAILAQKEKVGELQHHVNDLFSQLYERRKSVIPAFEKRIEALLEELNFPNVRFEVRLEKEKASFWMAPNVGERMVPVSDGISGGEMARLLLTLLILFSHEEGQIVLLFDEMDAHIGGTTAAKIGEKLKSLSTEHQVIAITHFPQVAEAADHHIAIGKQVIDDRTIATISPLNWEDRQYELARMSGDPIYSE
jgi:DNA repair protein RecN (Recombination protein N)